MVWRSPFLADFSRGRQPESNGAGEAIRDMLELRSHNFMSLDNAYLQALKLFRPFGSIGRLIHRGVRGLFSRLRFCVLEIKPKADRTKLIFVCTGQRFGGSKVFQHMG